MSAIETATKSCDNSPKISRRCLEQTFGTEKYLALSRTPMSVVTVSLGDQTILLQLASTINFRITRSEMGMFQSEGTQGKAFRIVCMPHTSIKDHHMFY